MISSFRNIHQLSKNWISNLSKRACEWKIIHIFSCVIYYILTIHLFCFLPSTQVFSILPPVLCVPNGIQKKPCVRQKSNAGLYQIAQGVTLGLPPQALSGDQSPDPIFASRRFKSSLLNDAHARRMPKTIKTGAKRRRESERQPSVNPHYCN